MRFGGLKKVGASCKRGFCTVKRGAKKYQPEIMVVTGIVSVVTGTVLACKATLKAQEVLAQKDAEIEDIEKAKSLADDGKSKVPYTDEEVKQDLRGVYGRMVIGVAKCYWLPVLIEGAGIALIFGSNRVWKKRCASLTAAYAALDTLFKKYRANVVEAYGDQVDQDMLHGVKKVAIEKTITDENGNEKKITETVEVVDNNPSPYSRFFDEVSSVCYQTDTYGRPDNEHNLFFIMAREKEANRLLMSQGYLFLNDVYKMLGFAPTIAGQSVGWVLDPSDESKSDNKICFNVFKSNRVNERFIEGVEEVVLLDFNVDGPIINSPVLHKRLEEM